VAKATAECVLAAGDLLGEVPIWCPRTKRLWWIDVRRPHLQSLDPTTMDRAIYPLPTTSVGSWTLREKGGAVVALRDGLYGFDPASGACEMLVSLEADIPGHRLNEGAADRRGRYWVGTMHDTVRGPTGSMYRIEPNRDCTKMFGGVDIPNSMVFSPDDRLMYFADTPRSTIWVFDFDLDAGALSNRRVFQEIKGPGAPDGSAIDADGCVWNAEYGGSRVVRYRPDGRVDRVIELPVTQPTCACFGGDALDTLYITTASQKLSPEQLAAQPLAGAIFAVVPGVKGMPEPRFAG